MKLITEIVFSQKTVKDIWKNSNRLHIAYSDGSGKDIDLPSSQGSGSALQGNGYYKTSDGLIIQWMTVGIGGSTWTNYNYPIPFPHQCFSVVGSPNWVNGRWYEVSLFVRNVSRSQFAAQMDEGGGGISVIAVGY